MCDTLCQSVICPMFANSSICRCCLLVILVWRWWPDQLCVCHPGMLGLPTKWLRLDPDEPNVLKSDLKKYRICPIWGPIWPPLESKPTIPDLRVQCNDTINLAGLFARVTVSLGLWVKLYLASCIVDRLFMSTWSITWTLFWNPPRGAELWSDLSRDVRFAFQLDPNWSQMGQIWDFLTSPVRVRRRLGPPSFSRFVRCRHNHNVLGWGGGRS